MRIGVIAVGYNCDRDINSIMAPWYNVKFGIQGYRIDLPPIEGVDFKIAVTTALFKEYADLGAKYDNQKTENYLAIARESGAIDSLNIIKEPILDYQSRVAAFDSIKHFDLDFIWQLDLLDEFYSYEDIKNTCNWIKENNLYDFYRINFKNYFGKVEDKTYVLDFKPVRIINNRRHGGIKNFYFDNDVEFNNGIKTPYCAGTTIPISKCNPKHLSWVGDKEFLTKKIQYQHRAIGCSSYKWDEENGRLGFDNDYYCKNNTPKPQIYKD